MALQDFLPNLATNPYTTYNPVSDLFGRLKGTRFDIPQQLGALGDIFNRGLASPALASTPQVQSPTGQTTQDIGTTSTGAGAGTGNLGDIIGGDFGAAGTTGAAGGIDVDKIVAELDAQTDRAADELIGLAQGDRDFAIKQLSAEHKIALGTGDVERAAFLEKVSSKLEEKIGTIPFDYERDIGRLEENRTRAVSRLRAEEKAIRGSAEREAETQRELQEVSLSERGLLTAPREEAEGLATKDIGSLESQIDAKFEAFERAIGEREEDITRTSTRGVEDVTTGARRRAGAAGRAFEFGTEAAERELERQKRQVELERTRQKQLSAGFAFPRQIT